MTDSERKHGLYGEPWTIYEGDANGRKYFIQGADAETEFGRIIAGMDFRGDDYLSRTDVWCRMRRAAQCVNACEGIDDPTAELTRLRARIEELEAVCQSLQEDVGHAMATANHREDQRAAAVDRYKQAEQRVEELERVAEERLMRAARAEASRAVLMQAMVDRARMGYGEWARQWIGKADSAAKDVRREDLVVATVNSAALDAAEG